MVVCSAAYAAHTARWRLAIGGIWGMPHCHRVAVDAANTPCERRLSAAPIRRVCLLSTNASCRQHVFTAVFIILIINVCATLKNTMINTLVKI